ncbi:unnamed protein product [Heligmosomoides polygyrus]|uniref:FBD domain-containing protein n=1 Tax=Heligmosomoides polygyrus TaxID=6339 RepID=A0A183FM11_HELPZ|nr:unnamed protein product [Heligmosomoides polygyrus]
MSEQGFDDRFSFNGVECLLQVDERKAQRQLVLSRHFDELRDGVVRLVLFKITRVNSLRTAGCVVHVSFLVQQDGPDSLPLRCNVICIYDE